MKDTATYNSRPAPSLLDVLKETPSLLSESLHHNSSSSLSVASECYATPPEISPASSRSTSPREPLMATTTPSASATTNTPEHRPPPISTATLAILQLDNSQLLTPTSPRWPSPASPTTTIPPSPTFSNGSSIRFAARSLPNRKAPSRRNTHTGASSLGMLSISRNTHRRKNSMSTSAGESCTSDGADDQVAPVRFGRSSFMLSQDSTLAGKTNVDEPEQIGEAGELAVEVEKTVAVNQGQSGRGKSASAKFRQTGKLAIRARRIMQRIWKPKPADHENNAELESVRAPPPEIVVTIESSEKVLVQPAAREDEVEVVALKDEISDLRAQLAQSDMRLSQSELTTEALREDLNVLQRAVEEMMQVRHKAQVPPSPSNEELLAQLQEVKRELVRERQERQDDHGNIYHLYRRTLIGR